MIQELYYFGCVDQCGHYLWDRDLRTHNYRIPSMPDGLQRGLDGPFTPPGDWPVGKAMASTVGDWKIISWWDRSVDKRPGSHSTFIGLGYDTHEALLASARILFRPIFERQPEVKWNP